MLQYTDIFVPGGFPKHTYNARSDRQLEQKLTEVKLNLCKLVTVTGQTKSGKTVLTRKILPQSDSIWIDGGSVSNEDDFWQHINEQLGIFETTARERSKESTSGIEATGSAQADFFVVKGEGALTGSHSQTSGSGVTSSRTVSPRVAAIRGLRLHARAVVIDDFHYLPKALQASVVRALKQPIFDGIPVVIIAIPHRRYDAMKVEREMSGRVAPIPIPAWSEGELSFIPETGFGLLGCTLPSDVVAALAAQAIGSPHLVQDFCREICKRLLARDVELRGTLPVTEEDLACVYAIVAETIGRPIFEKLARGPRQRTDRLVRKLKNGNPVDIYQLVLHALAHIRPGLVTLEYEDLRLAIRDVSASEIPQLHEVTRVLKHMATIAAKDESSTPVIDFEDEEKKLHITDPFFAFYLRWGELTTK